MALRTEGFRLPCEQSNTAAQEVEAATTASPAVLLLRVSRPVFWSTTIWFYLLPLAGRPELLGTGPFWLGLLYHTLPFGLLLYGWNDFGDRVVDRLNPRKEDGIYGGRASDQELDRLPFWIGLVQAPFLLLFAASMGTGRTLLWFGALLLANVLYNSAPFFFKARPPFDLLNQTAYLLVFVLSSWLNNVPQAPWQTFVFGALFAMQCHLFGEIMDVGPDRDVGRNTTAVVLGALPSKALLVAWLLVEALFVVCFLPRALPVAAFLALAALWFALDMTLLYRDRPYPAGLLRLFALGLNGVTLASLGWIGSTGAFTQM